MAAGQLPRAPRYLRTGHRERCTRDTISLPLRSEAACKHARNRRCPFEFFSRHLTTHLFRDLWHVLLIFAHLRGSLFFFFFFNCIIQIDIFLRIRVLLFFYYSYFIFIAINNLSFNLTSYQIAPPEKC